MKLFNITYKYKSFGSTYTHTSKVLGRNKVQAQRDLQSNLDTNKTIQGVKVLAIKLNTNGNDFDLAYREWKHRQYELKRKRYLTY